MRLMQKPKWSLKCQACPVHVDTFWGFFSCWRHFFKIPGKKCFRKNSGVYWHLLSITKYFRKMENPNMTMSVGNLKESLRYNCILCQQVVFETRRTPVITQFTSTVNPSNSGLLNFAFKRPFSLSIFAQGGLFLLPSAMILLHRFLIS